MRAGDQDCVIKGLFANVIIGEWDFRDGEKKQPDFQSSQSQSYSAKFIMFKGSDM